MNHRLVDRVARLVREDAGGEAGDQLLHSKLVAHLQDVVVHLHVLPEEVTVGAHVGKEATNEGSEVDHMGWLVLLKEGTSVFLTEEIGILWKNYVQGSWMIISSASEADKKR